MAVTIPKPVFKRDASGRTMDQRSVKIDSAIKQGNADYRMSQLSAKSESHAGKGSDKRK